MDHDKTPAACLDQMMDEMGQGALNALRSMAAEGRLYERFAARGENWDDVPSERKDELVIEEVARGNRVRKRLTAVNSRFPICR